jgi:hypothetical protein
MIAWVWAYSFLDAIINYCEQEDWKLQLEGKEKELGEKRKTKITEQAHHLLSKGVVPPPLIEGLSLEEVSQLWKEEDVTQENHCSNVIPQGGRPCIFAFVTGQVGQTKNKGSLNAYLRPFLPKMQGWGTENDMSHGWSRKLGIVATKSNAVLEFQFHNISQQAKTFTIHSMKSYGEKWEGSRAEFLVTAKPHGTADFQKVVEGYIDGIHNSTTSIDYTTRFDLEPAAEKGSDVLLKVTLVGGSTFKITGLMLCSR